MYSNIIKQYVCPSLFDPQLQLVNMFCFKSSTWGWGPHSKIDRWHLLFNDKGAIPLWCQLCCEALLRGRLKMCLWQHLIANFKGHRQPFFVLIHLPCNRRFLHIIYSSWNSFPIGSLLPSHEGRMITLLPSDTCRTLAAGGESPLMIRKEQQDWNQWTYFSHWQNETMPSGYPMYNGLHYLWKQIFEDRIPFKSLFALSTKLPWGWWYGLQWINFTLHFSFLTYRL
jgi:hypothetical protein